MSKDIRFIRNGPVLEPAPKEIKKLKPGVWPFIKNKKSFKEFEPILSLPDRDVTLKIVKSRQTAQRNLLKALVEFECYK